jgi:asparagine synthase (glutamine-hydrolysing)
MCGIVGLHGMQEDSWVPAMNTLQRHRGPDGEGLFRHGSGAQALTLGMRRLAILDLAGGVQPMTSPDGRFTLVFNGEIFNAPALRRELEASGERFETDHSDTEVLLRLLMRQGETAIPRLNGMFGFALFDRQSNTLLCARDRMGIKPLHHIQANGRFAFASEIKSLLRLPWIDRTPDPQSLFHYLSLMYVPGERTAFAGIRRLPAGHLLRYRLSDGRLETERWWHPNFTPDRGMKADEWPARIAATLEQAVARWNLSDVPVGCSLSGGLDSSAVVGFLARAGLQPLTFSVGFTGEGEEKWNELPLARKVAERWGTRHHEIVLDPETLLDELPAMVWHLDEPYGGGLPSWMVFKLMAKEVKVAMTGTGGDELFGNYGKWTGLEGRWPVSLLRGHGPASKERFRRDFFERYYYFPDTAKRLLVQGPLAGAPDTGAMLHELHTGAPATTLRDRTAWVDLATQLPEEFLAMTDRFSMAHSVEARTPFLDNELVALLHSVPAAYRTHTRDLKGLLRRTLRRAGVVPDAVLDAPKRGFVIPLGPWMRGSLRPLVETLLAPARLAEQGILSPEFFDACPRPHLEGKADHTTRLWGALMLQLWIKTFVERDGSRPLASIAEAMEPG